jgi:hypothetical protein
MSIIYVGNSCRPPEFVPIGRLSFPMKRFLVAILNTGKPPLAHGMAEHGGRVCTAHALKRRGLLDRDGNLTKSGRALAKKIKAE